MAMSAVIFLMIAISFLMVALLTAGATLCFGALETGLGHVKGQTQDAGGDRRQTHQVAA
jgi:hypothetical protein